MSAVLSKAARRVIATGLIAALLFLGVFGWRRLREGSYAGKPTRYWVEKVLNGGHQSEETKQAVIAIGPKAISRIVEEMTAEDSAWESRWVQWYDRFPTFFGRFRLRPRDARDRRFSAFSFLNSISDSIKGPRMRGLVRTLGANVLSNDQRPSDFVDAKNIRIAHGVYVRMVSAEILGNIGPDASEALPTLITALGERDKWKSYRSVLLEALGKIGPSAKDALPALREVMRSDLIMGVWAAGAVWRIDSSEKDVVNAFLVTALTSTIFVARTKAAQLHWEINADAKVVLPEYIKLIEDPANPGVGYTIQTLEDLGSNARAALPALSNKLSDKDEGVQNAAKAAIRKISAAEK